MCWRLYSTRSRIRSPKNALFNKKHPLARQETSPGGGGGACEPPLQCSIKEKESLLSPTALVQQILADSSASVRFLVVQRPWRLPLATIQIGSETVVVVVGRASSSISGHGIGGPGVTARDPQKQLSEETQSESLPLYVLCALHWTRSWAFVCCKVFRACSAKPSWRGESTPLKFSE